MKNKGFTLLELIIVITLLGIFFGLVSLIYINNIKAGLDLTSFANKEINYLSIYNQFRKQFISKYTQKNINIYITENRISFYTYYPIFFYGAVRAEYYIKREGDKYLLIYEEFPYVDGNLGQRGLKKIILGSFKNVSIEAYSKDKNKLTNYKNKEFPKYIKLILDNEEFFIY
jgi:prepilin-type N-terminal cleavage/methylation domain-containing protein